MQLIDELVAEHDLIDHVLGSLRAFVEARILGGADPEDGFRFTRFFQLFAGQFHHAREEDILFAALVEKAELPAERGPLAVMIADHAHLEGLMEQLTPLLGLSTLDQATSTQLRSLAVTYSHALWHHIDAENSVLLPESVERLRRHHITELPVRPLTVEELEARSWGEQLLKKYLPNWDAEALRGDGCAVCPAFGNTCLGLEREWWNEWEWEEFEDNMPKD
jgi:hemerythrin-like domain-containing protein